MLRKRISFGLVVVLIMVGLVPVVEAVPVGQSIYNTTQNLSIGSPNYYTDFGPSEAGYLADLWAVSGTSNVAGEAFLTWYGAGNLGVGDTNYQHGSIFYHFQTTGVFNGGTVTNSTNYQGGSQHSYVATTTIAPTTTNGWDGFSITPYDQKFYDQYWGEGVYSVNIPVGVQEFWVVVSKPDGGSSNNSYQRYVDVQANIIPEPATIMLLGFGVVGFLRRKK